MALSLALNNNVYEVGSFDAKTYFAELLRKVQAGFVISITKNGKPVAIMQSPERKKNSQALEAFNKLNAIGAKISARNSKNAISVSELHEIKNDGRKY